MIMLISYQKSLFLSSGFGAEINKKFWSTFFQKLKIPRARISKEIIKSNRKPPTSSLFLS